jgi:hypothetical protein
LHPRVADTAGDLGEALGLALLGAVGLDELHTFEALVDARREAAELSLGRVEVAINAALVDDVGDQQDREHGDRHGTEDDVGDQQPHGGEHDHQHGAGGVRDRGKDGDRRVGVDAGATDEVAVGSSLVPRDRLADQAIDDAF